MRMHIMCMHMHRLQKGGMAGRLTGRYLSKCLYVWSVRYTGINQRPSNKRGVMYFSLSDSS